MTKENFKEKVDEIKQKMRELFPETPLEKSNYLSKKYGANIYLKREDLTPVRSYKIRGAFHFISSYLENLKDKERKKIKFTCASAGNHAQGFALSCKFFKVNGTIFMPVTTPAQKVEMTKIHGGKYVKIVLFGDTFDEAQDEAKKVTKKTKAVFVPPFDHEKIMEGAATVMSEVLEQIKEKGLKKIDAVIFPVGGGGLSAGNTLYLKESKNNADIYYAEPEHAPSLFTSLKNDKNTKLDKIDTFVDGCAVKKIGDLTFEILKENIKNGVVLCPENRIAKTILSILHYSGTVVEPAGALSIDALEDIFANKKLSKKYKGKNIVCIVSGGNFDFSRLPDLQERKMKFEGTKKYIILKLPQRAGALKEFLNILGPNDDISRFEYLKKTSKNFGSVLIGIETNKKENFKKIFDKMKKNNFEFQDITDNQLFFDFVI